MAKERDAAILAENGVAKERDATLADMKALRIENAEMRKLPLSAHS